MGTVMIVLSAEIKCTSTSKTKNLNLNTQEKAASSKVPKIKSRTHNEGLTITSVGQDRMKERKHTNNGHFGFQSTSKDSIFKSSKDKSRTHNGGLTITSVGQERMKERKHTNNGHFVLKTMTLCVPVIIGLLNSLLVHCFVQTDEKTKNTRLSKLLYNTQSHSYI